MSLTLRGFAAVLALALVAPAAAVAEPDARLIVYRVLATLSSPAGAAKAAVKSFRVR